MRRRFICRCIQTFGCCLSLLPGCSGAQSDARSAYAQAVLLEVLLGDVDGEVAAVEDLHPGHRVVVGLLLYKEHIAE